VRRLPFILAVILVAGCSARTRSFRVPSSAMEPTIHCARPAPGCTGDEDDRVITRAQRTIRRKDIIVFKVPALAEARCGAGGFYVKRVIALPGETWSERGGRIYIDGKALREPYVRRARDSLDVRPRRVPPKSYIVLGDNRAQSCDSRVWGPLPQGNIVGTVIKIERRGGG
jgi:signal peptidase I